MSFKLDTTRRYVVTNLSFDGKTIQNIAVKEAFALFIFKVGQFPSSDKYLFKIKGVETTFSVLHY